MTSHPDLYPDVAAAGSLAAALELAADGLGFSLGHIQVRDADPLRSAGVESRADDRKPCWVSLGAVERRFILSGWSRGVQLISGATPDLGEMASALAAWRDGARLREIRAAAPFVKVGELAEAHERGPRDAVAVSWRQLLNALRREAGRSAAGAQSLLEVAEAAHAESRLRRLFPFTSHRSLHFSTCTGYPYSRNVPFVVPLDDGRHRVWGPPSQGGVIGETDTAEAAVALVVAGLPADSGPAVAGTADDPS